jgi:putative permease
MTVLLNWFNRMFSSEQALALLTTLAVAAGTIYFHSIFSPLLVALMIAYLLQQPINLLARYLPYFYATVIVFSLFMIVLLGVAVMLIPLIFHQIDHFTQEFPSMLQQLQQTLNILSTQHPTLLPLETIAQCSAFLHKGLQNLSGEVLKLAIKALPSALSFIVYLILMPLIIFFMNKDKDYLLGLLRGLYPQKSDKILLIAQEINLQLGNYIRGKVLQMIIVAFLCGSVFEYFGLNYALIFALSMGVSVFIPYVGATLATIPFVIAAYGQFGFATVFWQLLGMFILVQELDANLIVPLIFSEAVSLHPLFIIVAIIVFGSIGGVAGVFFAIPLASVIKALLLYWPVVEEKDH